jgi:hypothetical protein
LYRGRKDRGLCSDRGNTCLLTRRRRRRRRRRHENLISQKLHEGPLANGMLLLLSRSKLTELLCSLGHRQSPVRRFVSSDLGRDGGAKIKDRSDLVLGVEDFEPVQLLIVRYSLTHHPLTNK